MSKKTKIFIFIILIVVLAVAVALFYYYSKEDQRKIERLQSSPPSTDIDSLYSSFTDSMEGLVQTKLAAIDCEPSEYYKGDSDICFVCGGLKPCFGYISVEVSRDIGMKIAPFGPSYLVGSNEFGVEEADFYSNGLASDLDCQKTLKDQLDCGEIKIVATNWNFLPKDPRLKLMLKEGRSLEDFAMSFCELKGKELKEEQGSFSCGSYHIAFIESQDLGDRVPSLEGREIIITELIYEE